MHSRSERASRRNAQRTSHLVQDEVKHAETGYPMRFNRASVQGRPFPSFLRFEVVVQRVKIKQWGSFQELVPRALLPCFFRLP